LTERRLKIIISLILLYQKIAPEKLRGSCRFEPSCSNYMIMAIIKYGTIKGIYLGLKRLFRCRIPNGGYDYP
jgi:putative membrane protein insertion efficiency factor